MKVRKWLVGVYRPWDVAALFAEDTTLPAGTIKPAPRLGCGFLPVFDSEEECERYYPGQSRKLFEWEVPDPAPGG